MKPLIGLGGSQDSHFRGDIQALADLVYVLDPRVGCDDDDASGVASNDTEEAAAEVLTATESGDDDGNIIFGGVGGGVGQRDGLECPGGETVDNEASVTPEPV